MSKLLTYDIEIKNLVPQKDEDQDPNYKYCEGWGDLSGMGISLLGAHRSWDDKVEFFDEHNLLDFLKLIKEVDLVSGFNIHRFDTPLLKATLTRLGHPEETGMKGKCYDIFHDIKKGLNNNFPKGWSLDNVARATLGMSKTGEGADAPKLWQDGKIAQLITYLDQDVRIGAALLQHVIEHESVANNETVPCDVNLPGIRQKLQQIQEL